MEPPDKISDDQLDEYFKSFNDFGKNSPPPNLTPAQLAAIGYAPSALSDTQNTPPRVAEGIIDLTRDDVSSEVIENDDEDFGDAGFSDDFFLDAALSSEADRAAALHFLQENPLNDILGGNANESGTTARNQAVEPGNDENVIEKGGDSEVEGAQDLSAEGDEDDDANSTALQAVWDPLITGSNEANAYLATYAIHRQVRPANDDVAVEQPNLSAHARSIFDAIHVPPPKGSSKTTWTTVQQADYDEYQDGGYTDVKIFLGTSHGQKKAQSHCVLLVDKAFSLHTASITITNSNQKLNVELIFSERIKSIVTAMQIKRTAHSVCQGAALAIDTLIQDPQGVLTDRNNSVKNNSLKKIKMKAYGKVPKAPKGNKPNARTAATAASLINNPNATHVPAATNPSNVSNHATGAGSRMLDVHQRPTHIAGSLFSTQHSTMGDDVSHAGAKRPLETKQDSPDPATPPTRRQKHAPTSRMRSLSARGNFDDSTSTHLVPYNTEPQQTPHGPSFSRNIAPGYSMPTIPPGALSNEQQRRNTDQGSEPSSNGGGLPARDSNLDELIFGEGIFTRYLRGDDGGGDEGRDGPSS